MRAAAVMGCLSTPVLLLCMTYSFYYTSDGAIL